jgi:CDP-4-dehydro-6-deoxyglucose reductase
MSQPLSISRAARLAGVTRGELQKKIRAEGLDTFEGMVAVEDLVRLYDHIDMDSDPVFEKVQRIKAKARPKTKYTDGLLPDAETLMSRLKQFQRILVRAKTSMNSFEQALHDTLERLQVAAQLPDEALRQAVNDCIRELQQADRDIDRTNDPAAQVFARDALLQVITASVRLLPSGHEYFVNGNDSILEAGLKAGLNLDYGCTSGNCGNCKCRVVSGSVRKLQEHDYVLSAREQEDGYILACSNTAVTDLVIEAREAGLEDELPNQQIRARVRKIERTGSGLALMQVQTPRTRTLRFKAGQYVRLTAEDGSRLESYIASCPCDGRSLQFLIFPDEQQPFVRQVMDTSIVRQSVEIEGPYGDFVLTEESGRSLLFIARENGLGPIKSLLEQAITIDTAESLTLVRVGGGTGKGPIEQLTRAWADALDNFQRVVVEEDRDCAALIETIFQATRDRDSFDCYVAGPADWLAGVLDRAREAGLDTGTWHTQEVG